MNLIEKEHQVMTKIAMILAAASVLLTFPAKAEILSTTGLTQISPLGSATVTADWQINNGLPAQVIFPERQGVTLGLALPTDTGVIAAGTTVNSYFFGVNTYDCCANHLAITSVTFDGLVLGVVFVDDANGGSSPNYALTNFLGLPGLSYGLDCPYCGFEVGGNQQGQFQDGLEISGSTVSFHNAYSNPGDYARVITAMAVPGPEAGAGLLGLLLGGFFVACRRRRIKQVSARHDR